MTKISDLKPNPNNPRTISEQKFEELKGKIERNPDGLTANKIVHKDGIVIAGNQRFRAIQDLGLKLQDDWFKDVSGWTDEQIREYLIVSNISDGEWDWDKLANEWDIDELEGWGLEVPESWKPEDEVEEDEAPEVDESEPPKSKLGKVYQLGRHRVMCGSATSDDDLELLLDGAKPDMVFTDPPYGMDYSGRGENTSNKIMNDNIDPTVFYNVGSHIKERYVWGRVENYKHLNEEPRDTIIWKKNNFGMGRGYRGQYECCFYYGDFSGSDSDVWEIAKDTNYDHPTQKPVALAGRAIKNSKPSTVIDYFAGSGSTLIACEQTDRTCYGMELDCRYVDVIRKRWVKFVSPDNELPENWEELTPEVK